MESKQNYATVRQVQYVKDRLFEMEQKLNTNLAKVEQLKEALEARLELIAKRVSEYNSVAERVNNIISIAGRANDGSVALPQRLEIIDKKDFNLS